MGVWPSPDLRDVAGFGREPQPSAIAICMRSPDSTSSLTRLCPLSQGFSPSDLSDVSSPTVTV